MISFSDSRLGDLGWAFPALLLLMLAVLQGISLLARRRGRETDRRRGPTLAAIYLVMLLTLAGPSAALAVLLTILTLLGWREWIAATEGRPGMALLGVAGIAAGLFSLLILRSETQGASLALFLFFLVNASDSAAMVGGAMFGRRRLAPKISPGKTVEGSAAGVLAAMLLAPVFAAALRLALPPGTVVLLGALIAVVAQGGDLIASVAKRRTGIKDFGTILPGHGGILDRFDSTIVAAPVFLLVYLALP